MKSRIARRLALYFAAALLLFTVVLGALFIALFRAETLSSEREALQARAVSIAGALASYGVPGATTESNGSTGRGNGGMGGGNMGGTGAYLRFIDDIAMSDVWLVDTNFNLMTSSAIAGQTYNYADLPADAEKVIAAALQGTTTVSEGFTSLLQTPTLTVATPIQSNGAIVGVVLLHEPVEGASKATWQGVGALAAALPVALVLAVLLSGFLAVSFTRPLSRMNASALRLSAGDYTAKTGVRQKDEIGTLANSIDQLSDRLLAAQSESERLEELRRSFVANISHELKTPVTVIRGSLEALCDGVVTDPVQMQSYHRQMLKESLFLQRLINDLLDLSKLQNTEFQIEMQPLNLCDILSDAVRSAEHLAQKKEIELQLQLDVLALPITGDYGRLRQMLLIVLDNAIKFSPPNSTVELALSNRVVSVTDHGKGIAADELPHIFDRFYKAASADNQTGSGLGLAIAKQIAERHGVAVAVTSTAGTGSRFTFTF